MVRGCTLKLLIFFLISTLPLTSAESVTSDKPFLRLEAMVEGKDILYPGQRTTLVYRYYFRGDISLTVEKLPLLDAEGFIKIGEKEFNNSVQGTVSMSEISQQVEAVKPGIYAFGPSLAEGNAYKEDDAGTQGNASDKLSSEAPPVTLTVLPFPEKGKPASFNGAVGIFTFKTLLLSPVEMAIGDEISLLLEISGKGNLKNITAPDLCCQPGFSGFFRLSDLPPSEVIEGDAKKIMVKFRPLSVQIKAIPGIEFSYFDPETVAYSAIHSQPISITVKQNPQRTNEDEKVATAVSGPKKSQSVGQPIKPSSVPAPIEIEKNFPLGSSDLYNLLFGTWWALLIFPFGIMFCIYQWYIKEYLVWRRHHTTAVTARELFFRSFSDSKSGICHFDLLKKSLKLALVESKLLSFADISDEELPEEGLCGELKMFLALLDEKRFARNGSYDVGEVRRLSQDLIDRITGAVR